jgi:predicted NBD/HSP70 family sugar kinase
MSFAVAGSNAALLKRQNRAAVLRGILSAGPVSRRALCRRTGLTASTITHIVGELIAAGLVRELGSAEPSEGPVRVGRREVMIDLDPLGGAVVGGHIGMERTVLAVGDLRGGIIRWIRFPTQPEHGPALLVRRVAAEIGPLLGRAGVDARRVFGLGIGVVGPVDNTTGLLRTSHELGWRDVPLQALLEEATGLPTVVDSGRRGMALAEMMFGKAQGVRSFMLVNVGSTIVAGIVTNQQPYRGATGGAGSLGHLTKPGADRRCRCGRIGCLDTLASESAIDERAWEIAWQEPDSTLAQALAAESDLLPRQRLYAAARAGDPASIRVLQTVAHHLGEGIANVLSVLDPELVLIGGVMIDDCPSFVDIVRDVVHARAYRAADGITRVEASAFSGDLRWRGGLALALHDLFYAPALSLPAAGSELRTASM